MLTLNRRHLLYSALSTVVNTRLALGASTLSAEISLPLNLSGMPVPTFENGFLAVLDSELTTVTLIDMQGVIASTFSPRLPGAAVLRIGGVAVSRTGKLVLSLSAKDALGHYSFFFAMASSSGQVNRIVQLHPFAVRKTLFLPDGRLFCLGREYDANFKDVSGHHVARFYDSNGALQSTALPVEGLMSRAGSSHPVEWSTALAPDKIGLLDRESKQYCEIDYAGKVVRPLSKLEIDESTKVTGIVLLPNGDRLLTLDIPQKDNDRLRYGVTCGVVQITDAAGAGGLSLLSRHDLMPTGPNPFVTAIGSHNGKPVFFGRGPDRMLIFG